MIQSTNLSHTAYRNSKTSTMLRRAEVFWVAVIILGQWFMSFYILKVYGGTLIKGNLDAWNEILPHGIVKGDRVGNSSLYIHLLFAFIINVLGPLQLIPRIRNSYPIFHKWNGRVFTLCGVLAAMAGVIMTMTRGGIVGNLATDISGYINAFLILLSAYYAWSYALKKNFIDHQKWALRLFIVMSATFFIRIGFMFTITVVYMLGFDAGALGTPVYTTWSYLQYVLPLIILEIYLSSRNSPSKSVRRRTGMLLGIFTLIMVFGLFLVASSYWLPYIQKY